jgi:hypothetical protein
VTLNTFTIPTKVMQVKMVWMANEMRTFVTVKSDKPEVATRLQEIFKFEKEYGKYEPNALDIINNIKGTDYSYSNETTKEDWDKDVDFPFR